MTSWLKLLTSLVTNLNSHPHLKCDWWYVSYHYMWRLFGVSACSKVTITLQHLHFLTDDNILRIIVHANYIQLLEFTNIFVYKFHCKLLELSQEYGIFLHISSDCLPDIWKYVQQLHSKSNFLEVQRYMFTKYKW